MYLKQHALPHRYAPHHGLEVLERRKPLAYMEARIHLRHLDDGQRRKTNGDESIAIELSISESRSAGAADSRNEGTDLASFTRGIRIATETSST